MFADDTELYSSSPNDPTDAHLKLQNIEQCCSEIKNLMDKNKLKFNETKTEVLLCGPKHIRDIVVVFVFGDGPLVMNLSVLSCVPIIPILAQCPSEE